MREMRRQLTALLLAGTLGLSPAFAAEGFRDVPDGSWFEQGVNTCAENGIMIGTSERTFSPGETLTQAECLVLALRLYDRMRGGDGTFEKAPEDWGKITLVTNDGTTFTGYGDWNEPFQINAFNRHDMSLYINLSDETEAWGKSQNGLPATITVNGKTYTGETLCWLPLGNYILSFVPSLTGSERNEMESAIQDILYKCPGTDKWYRDAYYTARQWGLMDDVKHPAFYQLMLGLSQRDTASRNAFALALADAAGKLPQRLSIEELPDLKREDYTAIYELYEAGILTGIDEYGTFHGAKTLSRSEAAVMVARVLDETQRIRVAPSPLPYLPYTLTEIPVPDGWNLPESDSFRAAEWIWLNRKDASGDVEEALLRADGSLLPMEGAGSFSNNGSDLMNVARNLDGTQQMGILNVATGEMVIPFDAYDTCCFTIGGEILLRKSENEPLRLLDHTGDEIAVLPQRDKVNWNNLSNGLVPVESTEENDSVGYLDIEGNQVFPVQWDVCYAFRDGYAVVQMPAAADGEYPLHGVIDVQGNLVLPCEYYSMENCGEGMFYFWREEEIGIVNVQGEHFYNSYADRFLNFQNGFCVAEERYVDKQMQPATPRFDWATPIDEKGTGFVCKDGKLYRISISSE